MSTKILRVSFDVFAYDNQTPEMVEIYLQDLLQKAALPTLNLGLIPTTLTIKKARKY